MALPLDFDAAVAASGDDTDTDSDEWPDPTPLKGHSPTPPFPVGIFPDWIADHVHQVAEEFQFPPDLPAMLAITALSIVSARHAEVVVQGTWREPLNTYCVTAMPPSAAKSPAFKAMLGALDRWEAELIARAEPERQRIDTHRQILEKAKSKAVSSGSTAEALAADDDLRALPVVVLPRLMVDDITPEKLQDLLGAQEGRLALVSTEGGLFDMMTGKYSERSNLDVYLKAWSGDTIRVDRMTREVTTPIILHPALTVGLTVQPAVITKLAEFPELAGKGLTARFMYAFPPSNVGYRDMGKPPSIDPAVAGRYERSLLSVADRIENGVRDDDITLDDGARKVYVSWRQDMEDRCRPGGDLYDMQQWVTKLGSTVARLAGLLALADGVDVIDRQTMMRAVVVGRYWEAHGRLAFEMWVTDVDTTRARLILEWIAAERPEQFTLRDVYRSKRGLDAEQAAAALKVLVDNSWVRIVNGKSFDDLGQGKVGPVFQPHPICNEFVTKLSHLSHLSLKVEEEELLLLLGEKRGVEAPDKRDKWDKSPHPSEADLNAEPVDIAAPAAGEEAIF